MIDMIRLTAIAALTTMLILVLYLPAAHPPERFIAQLRTEDALNIAFWGEYRAARIMERMLDFNSTLATASPVPASKDAPATDHLNRAVASEMKQVNQRLFNNAYFRSIDALLVLATYRFSSMLEWLPALWFAILSIVLDGMMVRIVKSKEFKHHDPEMFALHACAVVLLGCGTVVSFVLPINLPVPSMAVIVLAVSLFMSRALANFPRRP